MPVQFILGRAGSGKSSHLLRTMTDLTRTDPLGPPIFFILPRQATFQAERALTVALGAFSRIRVVSFDQLGKDILIHCGDVGIPEVTEIGRRMVIGHLLRRYQTQLKFYAGSAHRRGLTAELDSAFGEFERAGLDVPALEELLNTLQTDDTAGLSLRDKLFDLHLLLQAYNQYIGTEKLDPQRRMSKILKRVSDCSMFHGAQVFVDDFYDFTTHERRLLTAVAAVAESCAVSLLIDPDSDVVTNPAALTGDLGMFHRTERTYRSLCASLAQAGVSTEMTVLLRGNHRTVSTDLANIEQNLFGPAVNESDAPTQRSPGCTSGAPGGETQSSNEIAVEGVTAPDTRAEVDAIARRIRSLTAQGIRYRQIGVLVRDLDAYQEIIHASFAEHGLPYFADRRRTAAHHPLLQMVRSALQIVKHRWPHEAVMTLIKTGLAGISGDEADELENYCLQHRIRGRMWQSTEPWAFTRELIAAEDETGEAVLSEGSRIDTLRRGVADKLAALTQMASPARVRDWAQCIFTMLEAFGVRQTLKAWMDQAEVAGDLERRNEHEQVWAEFTGMFDHMVDLLGEEQIELADFIDVLESGLESFDLALAPVKVDEILVGQIDRTRPPELKVVFVLGMNEGTFPLTQTERRVITDRERRTLRNRNIDLDPDRERKLLDERFLAYLAFTRASEKLIVSRTIADHKRRPSSPSIFWMELLRWIPDLPVQEIARSTKSDPSRIGTQRQLVTGLMRWVRSGADPETGPVWPALYQWMVTSDFARHQQAWRALSYNNAAELGPTLAAELFPWPMQASAAQLETMAECPFRHFARYGLQLRNREEERVSAIDLGRAYHDILENIVLDCLAAKKDWCSLKPAEASEMIRIHAAEIGRRLRGELMLSSARNRHMLRRIEVNLEQAVTSMCEIHRRGKYRPAFGKVRFGRGGSLPAHAVKTPKGNEVHLHGQIDRVDLNDKRRAFIAVDYKMRAGALAWDKLHYGLSLQLLTYLLVISANGEQLTGQKLAPAAVLALQVLRSPQLVPHPSEAMSPENPDFPRRMKPRGLIETRAADSLDQHWRAGEASAVIQAYKNKDGALGRLGISDLVEKSDFDALLKHVEKRIGELAEQISTGDVAVMPYMLNRLTPCSRCEYRSVCRFEPGINRYRMLQGMKREDVLVAVTMGK
jgi:ATP-dependent helicase/nuclease subunit B